MYDLIIIGGGPAGMTAAIYAAREKMNTLLITREFGGQMAKKEVEIENYPGFSAISARELIGHFERQVKKLKTATEIAEVKSVEKTALGFLVETDKESFESVTVLVATGADPRFLDVPGEQDLLGRGVGYCATCDGPLFAGRTVAVAGGGNAAFESALFLSKYAKKIYIFEGGPALRASADLRERVGATGKTEVVLNARIVKIEGGKFVSGVQYRDAVSGKTVDVPLDGLFIKIGHKPASAIVSGLADTNDMDEIKFDPATHMTKTSGLFVAGDVSEQKYKQIVIACGEGAKAALSISEYFQQLTH